ncbi:hypothetical protein FNV43_RR14543 [Rhamnella rubrinervis]|uniref:Uncharacterized protein n=1 Tax=Rhamnella rubrinervis TaxID=2594499 RepID=A0A8K0H366_9ROSA|nr:hypothetical protein FNV43_RR14543 [Rhamnella rubrinervis]
MGNPHVLVIPYPAQGHVIPLMELSQCLVQHGLKITFVNTEYIHEQVRDALAMMGGEKNQVSILLISDGLSLDDRKKPGKFSEAILRAMPGKVEELIEQINGSEGDEIACVLADQSIGWALEIAERKGIRRAAFCPAAAALLVQGFNIPKLIDEGIIDNDGNLMKKETIKLSSDMPAMNTANFVWTCLGNMALQKNIFGLMVRNNRTIKLADWLLCNSTYDLEPETFKMAPQILPIGPLLASNRLGDLAGNLRPEDSACLKWLDQQPPQSVIYIAFGSSTIFDPTQFQELAMGLELSNRPFLWVVRCNVTDEVNDAYPKGFLDRVATRGLVVSWAPQQKVLCHPSIACFLSHCGWNSTVEGVSNGVPFLCWPYFADQFLNESYICNFWRIGLGFDRNDKGIITQDEVRTKVEQLLGDEKIKARALAFQETAATNIREGGSSNKNFMNFVEWVFLAFGNKNLRFLRASNLSETFEQVGSTPLLKLLRALQARERGLLSGLVFDVPLVLFTVLFELAGVELIA